MISEGILAIAASSISAAITVFPDPLSRALLRVWLVLVEEYQLALHYLFDYQETCFRLEISIGLLLSVITESVEKMSPTILARPPTFSSTSAPNYGVGCPIIGHHYTVQSS